MPLVGKPNFLFIERKFLLPLLSLFMISCLLILPFFRMYVLVALFLKSGMKLRQNSQNLGLF